MRLSLYPDQRLAWSQLEEDCREAAEDGWDGLYLCDHLLRPDDEPAGYFLECWTTLAALAASLPPITVGSLVSANTLRHPALLAVMAAGVQQISGGRLVLGLGAGGDEEEHSALGLPFAAGPSRLEALAEACLVLRALLTPGPASVGGRHYRLQLADTGQFLARRPPLLVGVAGPRGLAIAAEHADRWAIWGSPSALQAAGGQLDDRCRQIGRDPQGLGRAAIVMATTATDDRWPAVLSLDPAALGPSLAAYRAAGVDELIVCDYALPRHRRSGLLHGLRQAVGAWAVNGLV